MYLRDKQRIALNSPIAAAIQKVAEGHTLIESYYSNPSFIPTDRELEIFEAFAEALNCYCITARYLHICLKRRAHGLSEDDLSFLDPKYSG